MLPKYIYIYIYIFIYMKVIQKIRWILPKKLAIGFTIYICSFYKDINNDGSFHVPEDYQHDLLYWPLYKELFLYWSVFPHQGLSFQLFIVANSCLAEGCPWGVMVQVLDCEIVVCNFKLTFTFRQIPMGKVWNPLFSHLWVK